MKTLFQIISVFFFYVSTLLGQPPQAIWIIAPTGLATPYIYSGGDEFEGDHLDLDKWATHGGDHNRKCNGELQYYTDDNIEVSDGTLKLIAKEEAIYGKPIDYQPEDYMIECPDGTYVQNNAQWWDYTSGEIRFKQPLKWKLIEVGCRLPNEGMGLWPAFWEQSAPGEEIDWIEGKGEKPEEIHINVHYPGSSWGGGWQDLQTDLTSQIWNYTFFWDFFGFGIVGWSFENTTIDTYVLESEHTHPHYLFINLAIASDDGGFSPGPNSSTVFPATFEISYVRFYTQLNEGSTIELCNYEQQSTDMTVLTGNEIILGGNDDCYAVIKNNEFLTTVATETVQLKRGFHAQNGSNFNAYTVDLYDKTSNKNSFRNELRKSEDNSDTLQNIPLNHLTKVKLYPNPTKGIIKISISGPIDQVVNIKVINSIGQVVYFDENIRPENSIDISYLSKGIYYLKIFCKKDILSNKIILK